VHGTGHPEVANAYKSLGNVHYKRGELADAERQYRHALTIYRRTKGDSHADTLSAQTSIQHIRYWMKERGNRDRRESRNPPPENHAEC
jgi:Tetratricopeptide repeat